jgi:hypothetical protein
MLLPHGLFSLSGLPRMTVALPLFVSGQSSLALLLPLFVIRPSCFVILPSAMLKLFDFALSQLRYLKKAMDEIPSFRPDGLTPGDVEALVASTVPVRSDFVTAMQSLEGARALRRTSIRTLHEACVDFGQQAPSAFRKNPTVTLCLAALPMMDRTIQGTLARAEAILAQWGQLPLIGTPPGEFTVAQVEVPMTRAGLSVLREAALAAVSAEGVVDQEFELERALLKTKLGEVRDLLKAALALGRSQFPKGTMQREVISAIPKRKVGVRKAKVPPPVAQ